MSCRAVILASLVIGLTATSIPAADPPRLVVVVFFDQLRGDYIERWRTLFVPDGFRRLQDEGAWFSDCHYPFGTTTTGPGHASVLAGCSGDIHGIINNNWYDRRAGAEVYCAGSTRYELVPAPPASKPPADARVDVRPSRPTEPKSVGNPDQLLAPSVADVLKEAREGKGKIFGLSLKDRSAIFPTGKSAHGAYWFNGQFVTSTYYRDAVHPWVADFNKSGIAESYFGKDWVRFRPDLDYTSHSGPDLGPGEGKGHLQGEIFPHPTTGGLKEIGPKYYQAVANSPFGNDLLLAFTKSCIEVEKLGADDVPDLLTVSFSSNDPIGHTWGPDSQEVLDITLRSDALMADFLRFLDEKVGKGRYAMIVTSDHGVCPNPEVSTIRGIEAKRISPIELLLGAERFLRATYGRPDDPELNTENQKAVPKDPNRWLEAVAAPSLYLNERLIRSRNLEPEAVAAKLAEWGRTQPGIARAFTRKELMTEGSTDDEITIKTRRSYHPERGGDVVIVLKPYHIAGEPGTPIKVATGTTHGSPYPYDTHVAFLAFGPGIPGGRRTEIITPQHAAAIAAHLLGIKPPKFCYYELPRTLLRP